VIGKLKEKRSQIACEFWVFKTKTKLKAVHHSAIKTSEKFNKDVEGLG
jgi:hypothetical protein